MKTKKVRAIGVANLKYKQFQDVLDIAKIKPVVLQVNHLIAV